MTSDDVATGSWSKAAFRCNHLEEVKRGTFSYMCRAGGSTPTTQRLCFPQP